jgi:hypothetical protein
VVAEATYSYALFARDAAGNTSSAATVTVTTPAAADVTPPGPVNGVQATSAADSVALAWTNPADVDPTP